MYTSIMNSNNFDEYKSPSVKAINVDMSNTILTGSNNGEPTPGSGEGLGNPDEI